MSERFFPRGIPDRSAFLNREGEQKRLASNLKKGTHTVLMAPRRYGKTSLAKLVIQDAMLPFSEVDLFVTAGEQNLGAALIRAVNKLLQEASLSAVDKARQTLGNFVSKIKSLKLSYDHYSIELGLSSDKTSIPEAVLDILNAAESLFAEKKLTGVIFIDEFQEVMATDMGKAIEGAIRNFAQSTKHIVFIFSGSDRHMLEKMFEGRSRPLFALCDEIKLTRISEGHYREYFKRAFVEIYQDALTQVEALNQDSIFEPVIAAILELSERHPRYIYFLAAELTLAVQGRLPQMLDVHQAWRKYVISKNKDVRKELEGRSPVQIKLFSEIALGNNQQLSSFENQQKLKVGSSTIVQALKVLEQHDFIEADETKKYRVIDPLLKWSIKYQAEDLKFLDERRSPEEVLSELCKTSDSPSLVCGSGLIDLLPDLQQLKKFKYQSPDGSQGHGDQISQGFLNSFKRVFALSRDPILDFYKSQNLKDGFLKRDDIRSYAQQYQEAEFWLPDHETNLWYLRGRDDFYWEMVPEDFKDIQVMPKPRRQLVKLRNWQEIGLEGRSAKNNFFGEESDYDKCAKQALRNIDTIFVILGVSHQEFEQSFFDALAVSKAKEVYFFWVKEIERKNCIERFQEAGLQDKRLILVRAGDFNPWLWTVSCSDAAH